MATNGRPPHAAGAMPSWNPAALLQPGRRTPSNSDFRDTGSNQLEAWQQVSRDRPDHGNSVVFQFASPCDTPVATPPSGDNLPQEYGHVPETNGMGNWIERMNNVEHRAAVPQAKRRKIIEQGPASGTTMPVRGGSGNLGEYVRERRKEASTGITPQTSTVDLTAANDEDEDVQEGTDPREEEVCYGMIKTSVNCSKVPSPKPGIQSMWGPTYQPSIKVILKRTAGDKSIKIPVCDHTREIIGLVAHSAAEALVPLLDSNVRLRTDCRIPPQPKKPDEEPGQAVSRAYSLDVVMYGPLKYTKNIGVHLNRHGLRLLQPYILQRGIKLNNPHSQDYQQPNARPARTDSNGALSSAIATRTVEEVRSEVMGVFDSLSRTDDLPGIDAPPSITTPLLNHQRQGLYFMMTREKPRDLMENEKGMVSFWQNKIGPNGQRRYYNVITGESESKPPQETRGGILADMMGLGKTLSILSLIVGTTEEADAYQYLQPDQPSAPETKASRHEVFSARPNLGLTPVTRNAKTTLIICPLSTVANWEEQIKQHVLPDSLSYHIYHGSNRIKDAAQLASFDIVITTYGSVSNELSARQKGKGGRYPLEELGWFRIVLDEAHMIREQSTMQFKAIVRLQAQRRWAVTGTPVQNRLDDFAALLSFLRLHPFHARHKFVRHIVEPFKACDPTIVPKLRVLVDTITLRRLKDKIDLPPRSDLVVKLDFTTDERSIYNLFARNAQDRVKVLAGGNTDRALGGNTYIHILKAILRLRLLCAHGKDLLNEEDLSALRGMSAEMAIDIDDDDDAEGPSLSRHKALEMFKLMQDTNNDACIECSRRLSSHDGSHLDAEREDGIMGYMTPCFHIVCRSCVNIFKDRARAMLIPGQVSGQCPVCNTHVRQEFIDLHREDVDGEHDGLPNHKPKTGSKNLDKYEGPHTKTKALIDDLLKSRAASEANPHEPPFKSVVFSGWTSHLDLIEIALRAANITFTRLDGSMSRMARTAAMDSFRDDNRIHVILVSIMAGGLGLNLTAGNNVYVMEPQYNPAAEAQAIDRVHRLGQKRPVRTIRYIMRDSFEEKMLELQEKKMKLASLSMDGQNKALDKAEAARQKLMDLRSLFNQRI